MACLCRPLAVSVVVVAAGVVWLCESGRTVSSQCITKCHLRERLLPWSPDCRLRCPDIWSGSVRDIFCERSPDML